MEERRANEVEEAQVVELVAEVEALLRTAP